jgi:hypothetical protein
MGARTTDANSLSWVINELVLQNRNKTIDFNVSIQRGYVWDNKRCSLLIHSILLGIPISEFYLNKVNDIYGGLEGKQRNKAICDYVNDGYKLHANTPPVQLNDGSTFNVAKHLFSKLPEELQNRIMGYSLRIYWFDNASLDDQVLIFTRINSGKPVTAGDISRIKVKSRKDFCELADHAAIDIAVREKGKLKFVDEDIVQDIWLLSYTDTPSLLNKYRSPVLETEEMTKEQKKEMTKAFDYLLAFFKSIEGDAKYFSKLRAKIQITSLGQMSVLAVKHKIKQDDFIAKAKAFFNGEGTKVTNNEAYNTASIQGSARAENVKIRTDELTKALGL